MYHNVVFIINYNYKITRNLETEKTYKTQKDEIGYNRYSIYVFSKKCPK